ncbi:Endonuclease/exonuclease/phosphatase [Desulfovibrio sp. X2]|uniref:endonuclease/exonuclease/phosphatase family protein n=1 Tax=Desulfovibrio sp. X2 TaxID=941449 RepID=UPI00035884DC|nr:endonuclease/exonuclease/phosphatase family protein [Desulfovibrio sp. X2]EPR44204.1 Endonuclease/exonuclease/phosphatase [Desulfovibrio sp. X2]
MKIATWNLNHRAGVGPLKRAKPIVAAISALDADVVVLTEYVRQPRREDILPLMSEMGWHHLSTLHTKGENSVLIVSKSILRKGRIVAPQVHASAPPNALHVHIPSLGLEILGLRVPDYSKSIYRGIRATYWDWLMTVARDTVSRPFLIIGDLNTDPSYSPSKYGDRLHGMVRLGWQHALPGAGWSYKGNATKPGGEKRLDHAFVTGHFEIRNSSYVSISGEHVFAGDKARQLSDHAPLVVDLEPVDINLDLGYPSFQEGSNDAKTRS